MVSELRLQNQSQQLYIRALSSAYRNGTQLHDPALWLNRDPEIEEKMLRDADIAHAVTYRRHCIAGRQWSVVPKLEDSPRSPVAVAVATELLDGIKHFTDARLNLARAFFSGARFGRIHGEAKVLKLGDGQERTWWCPTRIEDIDKRLFRIVPKFDTKTDKLSAHWEKWSVAAQKWVPETELDAIHTIRHVYQDDQASLGHGRALREALGWIHYAKTHVFEESLNAAERFGQGILKASVDGLRDAGTGLPNEQLIEKWLEVLENMRSRHVMAHDSADTIEMVQVQGDGWQLLESLRNELRSSIFTLVMGANLTTSADKGGSYALAEVQENSTETLIQYDRETLEETLTDDLLGCIWYENHANLVELGIVDEKPRFSIVQQKREDPQERATVAQLLNGMGVELSLEDVLDQTGFRKPQPGEEVIQGRQAMNPASPFDPGGGGGGSPFGDLPSLPFEDEMKQKQVPPQPAAPQAPPGAAMAKRTKKRKGATK